MYEEVFCCAVGVAIAIVAQFAYAGQVNAQSTNNFTITNYEADYYLGSDGEGRSTLRVVEKITADFTSRDQNRGLERAIPKKYDGHTTSLKIDSVTNESGKPLEYSDSSSNGNLVLRIGDEDTYVNGPNTYVITYTQRDITKYFSNTQSTEFYWDINGVDWKVPIQSLSARIHLSDSITPTLTDKSACYQGSRGSTDRCQLERQGDTLTVGASNLRPGQNVTVAVGFTAGTFRGYEPSLLDRIFNIWVIVLVVSSILSVIILIYASIRWYGKSNRKSELGTIVPEYIPPKQASVTTSATVISGARSTLTAQLMDLAVRHYIKIYETREKSTWKPAEYELEIIKDISDLRSEEQEVLKDMFDGKTSIGERLALKTLQNNYGLVKRMQNNDGDLKKLIRGDYQLRHQVAKESKWFKTLGAGMMILSVLIVSPLVLIVGLSIFAMGATLWPLTAKGLDLRRYLEGLKLYIGVAETERLKMLQSPEGAEKVGAVDQGDQKQLVKLYERVLPYAILFGQEKEWGNQMGRYYESIGSQPDWYSGANASSAFNAVVLSSAISNFNTAASYTSASSSSSGGSAGGGSSGGGGGGGGGGGW